MIRWLIERLRRPRVAPQPRLSQREVLEIARSACASDALCDHLSLATFGELSGRLVWTVSSATIGQMLEVTVDDTSGEVLAVQRVGVR